MADLHGIEQFLQPETKALIPDDANWSVEQMQSVCKLCGEPLEEDDHFHLLRNVGDQEWCMDFHYGCAVIVEYAEAWREEGIDGWIPSDEE